MANKLQEVLKLIGWTDGYHVPVLNQENDKLSKKIEGMLKEKANYIIVSEDLSNRVSAIEDHIKDVKLRHQHIQELIYSYRKCEESEDHMSKVALREEEKLKQDISKYTRMFIETSERNDSLECEIKQLKQNMELLKKEGQFDQETLNLWEEEISLKEEENQIIECYFNEDDVKVKDQNRQLEKLHMELIAKQQKMEKITCDIQSQELTLERICSLFRKMHANRQYLIQQWESCVSYMGKRDEDIAINRHELNDLHKTQLQLREKLLEEERFLEGLQRNNKETEIKTQSFNREAAILVKRRDHAAHILDELKTETNNTRKMLANAEKQVELERCKHKHLMKESLDLEVRVEQMNKLIVRLEKRLEHVKTYQMTSQERTAQLEEIFQNEELRLKEIDVELKSIQGNIFRNQSRLQELKKIETSHLVMIRGMESEKKMLIAKKHSVTRDIMQKSQQEYHLGFLIQKLETRIARITGKEESDSQKEMAKKIEKLEKSLAEKAAEKKFLTTQKTKLEVEERQLRAILKNYKVELDQINSRKDEESTAAHLKGKALMECREHNQNLQVEENILRLKTSKADSALVREGDKVFSLEKESLEIDTALKERKLEINMEKEVLEAKRRAVSDEVSLLNLEVKHMQTKISQLQKRYEIATVCLASGESDADEPMSLIRFNLKIAQEKQELQEEGDRLEKQIQKAEKEIQAMEATLRLVGCTNDAYKRNLYAVDGDAPELIEKKKLDEQLQELLALRRQKNSTLIEHQNELAARTTALNELDAQIAEMASALKEETVLATGLTTEIQDQSQKQGRADLQARRLQVELRRQSVGAGCNEPTFDERDYYMRQLNASIKSSLNLLVQLVNQDPEMHPKVEILLEEKGLTKAYHDSKLLHSERRSLREGSHALRSSMTMISPKLLPPVNTPVTSVGGQASPSSQKSTVPSKAVPSTAGSGSSPALLTIDSSLFSQAKGRTSGTYKGVSSKSRLGKRDHKK